MRLFRRRHGRQFVVVDWTDPAKFTADKRRSKAAEATGGGVETQVAGQCCPTYGQTTQCRRRCLEHRLSRYRLRRLAMHVYHTFARTHQHLKQHDNTQTTFLALAPLQE